MTLAAFALEESDLAAVKLLVGRAKDLTLVRLLRESGRITAEIVRERIDALDIPVEMKPRLLANIKSTMA